MGRYPQTVDTDVGSGPDDPNRAATGPRELSELPKPPVGAFPHPWVVGPAQTAQLHQRKEVADKDRHRILNCPVRNARRLHLRLPLIGQRP
jgi:hypothetical protein